MAIDPRFPAQEGFEAGGNACDNATDGSHKTPAAAVKNDHFDSKVFCRDELVRRCGGDAGIASRLADKFRARSDHDLKALEATVREGDIDSIVETAHRLKGVAASMAAHRLAECYRQLEAKARAGDLSDMPGLIQELKTETALFNDAVSNKMAGVLNP